MHVMVATDGSLDAKKTAAIAAKLAAGDGRVTVFTVVEVPRGMLDEMRAAYGSSADQKAREITLQYRSTQADDTVPTPWVGDDAIVARYVNDKVAERTAELVAELDAVGLEFDVIGEEGENAAQSVLKAAETHGADVLCIGTHGLGRFEGMLGSLSTKVARLAQCSVVLVR
jgi:nucleotide-binding universal stress UspA family protein